MANKIVNLFFKTKGAKEAEKSFKNLGSGLRNISGIMKGVFASALVVGAANLSKTAAEAEGVKIAFDRLNRPELLRNLRQATKGTVSDIELMKRAVTANNFRISLEQLPTLLKFAQQRARETGESVDYLVNSIVTGIGRKSPLILDNLGLSAIEVRDEFKKTGDMAKAVGNIINREFAKSGEPVNTLADDFDRTQASIDNMSLAFGEMINTVGKESGAFEFFTDMFDFVKKGVEVITGTSTINAFGQIVEKGKQAASVVAENTKQISQAELAYNKFVLEQEEARAKAEQLAIFTERYNEALARQNGLMWDAQIVQSEMLEQYPQIRQHLEGIEVAESSMGDSAAEIGQQIQNRNQQLLGSFSNLFGNIIRDSRNAFDYVMDAFTDLLSQMAARAAAFGILNLFTGGSLGATTSFLDYVLPFAKGGDFMTNGPQLIMVGDNPGGRERVQITPQSSPNINGPQGNVTININGPIMGGSKEIARTLKPELDKLNMGYA